MRDLDLSVTTPPPLTTLDEHGHVIYLRSLSKIVAPGLRVAAMVAWGPTLARLRSARLITDFFVSPLLRPQRHFERSMARCRCSADWMATLK